jgi:hypothetical protein
VTLSALLRTVALLTDGLQLFCRAGEGDGQSGPRCRGACAASTQRCQAGGTAERVQGLPGRGLGGGANCTDAEARDTETRRRGTRSRSLLISPWQSLHELLALTVKYRVRYLLWSNCCWACGYTEVVAYIETVCKDVCRPWRVRVFYPGTISQHCQVLKTVSYRYTYTILVGLRVVPTYRYC